MRGLIDQVMDYLSNEDGKTNSGQGYCKLPNGTLIQWGSVTVPQGTYTANWNCPVAFANKAELGVCLTPLSSGTSYNVNYSSSTTSSINIGRTPNTAAHTYYIIAIGRWR